MNMKSKKGFEMSFGVIFSIIAGAIILFLAIYATTRLFTVSKTFSDTEAAAELSAYLNPIVNGIASDRATQIEFSRDTRTYYDCYESSPKSPYFGSQTIAFSESSGIIRKWSPPGYNISKYNKYIFADAMEEGKTLFIYAKPFSVGFRVDDLVMLSAENYCLANPPENIKKSINDLGIVNINATSSIELCPKKAVIVCFNTRGPRCNISVYPDCNAGAGEFCESEYDIGYVEKQGRHMSYYGSLMYAAIFSSPDMYECNIRRLMKKTVALAEVYKDKIDVVKTKNCETLIGNDLDQIIETASRINNSGQLYQLYPDMWDMDSKNCNAQCQIYAPESCSLYD
jgi:hypothetical protein